MHLYYARFFNHFLYDEGLLPAREPFVNLLTQGMVMGQAYQVRSTGKYLRGDEVERKCKFTILVTYLFRRTCANLLLEF